MRGPSPVLRRHERGDREQFARQFQFSWRRSVSDGIGTLLSSEEWRDCLRIDSAGSLAAPLATDS